MRVLVLGATGMLGHKVYQHLQGRAEVYGAAREGSPGRDLPLFGDGSRLVTGLDGEAPETIRPVLEAARPDAVVNCVGVIKQLKDAEDPVKTIAVNALFPHLLARACRERGARLVHVSTDCVFSGEKGGYREEDPSDAKDLYGRTKHLGEVTRGDCVTLRTSIIGRELKTTYGLLEWFLSQRGRKVDGYTHAVFSGVTTQVLAEVIWSVLARCPGLRGLYHVAAAPIAKFDLLALVSEVLDLDIEIAPSSRERCDRSLDGSRFAAETGLAVPPWREMVEALAKDATPYNEWRSAHALAP